MGSMFRACSGAKFLVPKQAEAYDARTGGPDRNLRLNRLLNWYSPDGREMVKWTLPSLLIPMLPERLYH